MTTKKFLILCILISAVLIALVSIKKEKTAPVIDAATSTAIDLGETDNLIAYGHVDPKGRDFLVSIVDLNKHKEISRQNLGSLFTRKIFYHEKKGQIWIPAESEKDLKYVSNKIKILNIENSKITEIEVGLSPVDIQFIDNTAVVTCLERGIRDVSVYLINTDNLKQLKKITVGGDTFEFSDLDRMKMRVYLVTEDVDNKVSKLSVIDLKSYILKQYNYPNIPLHGIKLINNQLWLAGGNQIQVVNPVDGRVTKEVRTEVIAYELQYDGDKVYLSHYYPDTQQQKGLSIIDPKTWSIKKVPLPNILPTSVIEKDKRLYIVDEMTGILHVMNTNPVKQINSVKLGKFPTNVIILN